MRRRPLLRFAVLLLVAEILTINFGLPLDPRVRSEGAPDLRFKSTTQRARIQGTIIDKRGASYIVEGEVDAKNLPAVQTRFLLRVKDKRVQSPETVAHLEETRTASVGSCIEAFCTVRRPLATMLPNTFNEAEYCRSRNVFFVAECMSADIQELQPPQQPQQSIAHVREYLSSMIDSCFEDDVSVVIQALVLGNDSALDARMRESYSTSGTAHVLSVSGMHVSLVGGMLFLLFGGKPRNVWITSFCLAAIAFYVLLTGAESPAVRAGIMCCIAIVGKMRERSVDGLNILGVAVLIQLLADPHIILDRGFILSTSATFSILACGPPLHNMLMRCIRKRNSWKGAMVNVMTINLAATGGTAIPAAMMFGQIALWSVVANVIVIPLFSVALIGSLFVLMVYPLLPSLAEPAIWCIQLCVRSASSCTELFSAITPKTSAGVALVVSVVVLASTLWSTVSHSWIGLITRQGISAVFAVSLLIIPDSPRVAMYCSPLQSSLEMLVVSSERTYRARLYTKNGAVFVRSRHVEYSSGF